MRRKRKREIAKSKGILFGSPPGSDKGWVFGILKY
jgi:hypothetical protein